MPEPSGLPVLAGRAGEYCERHPGAALAPHVQCLWWNAIASDHAGPMAVVPDGCIDLVWLDGRLFVAGPDVEAEVSTPPPGALFVGARFRPGAAARWLGLPMAELVGRRVELEALWGAQAKALGDRIAEAPSRAEKFARLEAGLAGRAGGIEWPAPEIDTVFRALRAERDEAAGLSVVLACLDVSPRSLRRHCSAEFGYGPKTLGRILRFQRFLNLARRPGDARLWSLAYEAGYADQAHLTREVRRLSGLTPRQIVAQVAA
jgi:AraC-like DNA-binding protein